MFWRWWLNLGRRLRLVRFWPRGWFLLYIFLDCLSRRRVWLESGVFRENFRISYFIFHHFLVCFHVLLTQRITSKLYNCRVSHQKLSAKRSWQVSFQVTSKPHTKWGRKVASKLSIDEYAT